MRWALIWVGLAGTLSAACAPVVDPQTVVHVVAGPRSAARAQWLRITVEDQDGEVRLTRTDRIGEVVELPARVPVTAEGGNATRRFELVAELFDGEDPPAEDAASFNRGAVRAGFVEGAVQEVTLRLGDACIDGPACGEGQTCWLGECRGSCFAEDVVGPSCTSCQRCAASGVCTDRTAGANCGCPGDTCQGGQCEHAVRLTEVAGGLEHTCALSNDRGLHCWGSNALGQLGDDGVSTPIPRRVAEGYLRLAAGGRALGFTCGIEQDRGPLRCWGSNEDGKLGIGDIGVATRSEPSDVEATERFERVALGARHACALEPDGALQCWGSGSHLKLGNARAEFQTAPVAAAADARWQEVCTGAQHTCGLDSDGVVFCWGFNQDYQLGSSGPQDRAVPSPVDSDATRFTALSCGSFHTCALSEDGAVHCWGGNDFGNLGRCAVDRDEGTGSAAAIEHPGPFEALDCGGSHCCALVAETRALVCWGRNTEGQLGDGTTPDRVCTPREIAAGLSFSRLGLGERHTCAIDEGGGLWCWGDNGEGQLGVGDGDPRLLPSRVCPP